MVDSPVFCPDQKKEKGKTIKRPGYCQATNQKKEKELSYKKSLTQKREATVRFDAHAVKRGSKRRKGKTTIFDIADFADGKSTK